MEIGENIKIQRIKLKMTQKDLSRKTGIKQPTISAIENGVNKPAIETIMLISEALSCTVSDLVGQKTDRSESDPMLNHLIAIFNQLNPPGRNFLLQQAESIIQQPAFRQEGSASLVG